MHATCIIDKQEIKSAQTDFRPGYQLATFTSLQRRHYFLLRNTTKDGKRNFSANSHGGHIINNNFAFRGDTSADVYLDADASSGPIFSITLPMAKQFDEERGLEYLREIIHCRFNN
ncbi:MAG: hypothetical protein ETSY2_50220 [Candidatus Entotheonella gemina]|uniref:Uncharacterized protein n=1 Tax=Candidatus Entotheonella gemina TaxID=1429439 RepID=W4LA13_9BACT|nr:MAG: hypothetical protein ETSY2_50220 [Candidatus Entotheonella gemina]